MNTKKLSIKFYPRMDKINKQGGANKTSYIDNFMERSAESYHFTEKIKWALKREGDNWF